jgi:hypothetical protein
MAYVKKIRTRIQGKEKGIYFNLVGQASGSSTVVGGQVGYEGTVVGNVVQINKEFFNQPLRFIEKMMDKLTWQVSGVKIQKYIAQIAGLSITRNFATETGAGVRHWKALAKSTKKTRVRQGFGERHPILKRSGNLFIAATKNLVVTPGYSGDLSLTIEPSTFKPSTYDSRQVSPKTGKKWRAKRSGSIAITPKAYFMAHQMGATINHPSGATIRIPRRTFFSIRHADFEIIGNLMAAAAMGQANAIARRNKSNETFNQFALRVKELKLYERQFLYGEAVITEAGRNAVLKAQTGQAALFM